MIKKPIENDRFLYYLHIKHYTLILQLDQLIGIMLCDK